MKILRVQNFNVFVEPDISSVMTIRQKISLLLLLGSCSLVGCATPLYQMPSGYSSTYVKAAQVTPVEITPLRRNEQRSR
ncbi:hypothetical protein Pan54_17510 [Rubinisphaera italica]|uniref:Lipoprotein n=1 Tax=Rubinisphaera italica TaxID=2527969 RepID=A0A5C5XDX5_9PLAN|nr:hypothetical protein Pan54_17510 [Rubinisphaera italica]